MGTGNFWTMDNFPLYAQTFWRDVEEDDKEYLTEEEVENGRFHDDIFADDVCDGVRDSMQDLQNDLIFHKLELKSGYYDGVQFYVEEIDNPNEMDNDSCYYHFDFCRSISIRKYNSEINKVCKMLKKLARDYYFDCYEVSARFGNGETWYNKVEEK